MTEVKDWNSLDQELKQLNKELSEKQQIFEESIKDLKESIDTKIKLQQDIIKQLEPLALENGKVILNDDFMLVKSPKKSFDKEGVYLNMLTNYVFENSRKPKETIQSIFDGEIKFSFNRSKLDKTIELAFKDELPIKEVLKRMDNELTTTTYIAKIKEIK